MELHENNITHLPHFISLNEQWIKKYFFIEAQDKELAAKPRSIIDTSGFFFTATIDNTVVACCALRNEGAGIYEMARMAVAPNYQRLGMGQFLVNTCLSKARSINAAKVYLVSNTTLTAALALYQKSGFVEVPTANKPSYTRANIVMEIVDFE